MKIGDRVRFERTAPFLNLDEERAFRKRRGKIYQMGDDYTIIERNSIMGRYFYTLHHDKWKIIEI